MGNRWPGERWAGIARPYTEEDVDKISGSLKIEYTLARKGAEKLWHLLNSGSYIRALGALNGQQAVQMAKAGLKAIYVSGWQVAAAHNTARSTYPDQSLYPPNSVPDLVEEINNSLERADQIQHSENKNDLDYYLPLVADAEAGFGGALNAFELMKAMIKAGAAAVHFEDQLGSEKKCGHLGGKVLVPTSQFIRTLVAARLAADMMGVPTVLIARTDAESATLLTSDIDDRDKEFILGKVVDYKDGEIIDTVMDYGSAVSVDFAGKWTHAGLERIANWQWTPQRTPEGYYRIMSGLHSAISRALCYAPYADMLWMETKTPDLEEARKFAEAIHEKYPGKLLAYNCSPSFNWRQYFGNLITQEIERVVKTMPESPTLKAKCLAIANLVGPEMPEEEVKYYAEVMDKYGASAKHLTESTVLAPLLDYLLKRFQSELGKMGYKFQFVTLAGFHSLNYGMFTLAKEYSESGMLAYSNLQEEEFGAEKEGYTAVKHQREVGTGYFDEIQKIITGGTTSTTAMEGSTEKDQFEKDINKTDPR